VTYLITFVCYGRHLHGCESGSVDQQHNVSRKLILEVDSARAAAERELIPSRRRFGGDAMSVLESHEL
jgi:hypothetical protein